jgi:carbon monoxide dehydrogenase subunit G
MKMAMSMVIDCTPRELWPWLDDPEKLKQWMKGVLEVRSTSPGPRRKGSTAVCVIQEGGRPVEYRETFLEYEPERHLKLRMEGGRMKTIVIDVEYTLEELGRGTRLDYGFACELPGPMLKLFGPLMQVFARMQVRRFFKKLKSLAEGGASVATSA